MSLQVTIRIINFIIFTSTVAVESRIIHSENSIEYDSEFDTAPLLAQASHSMSIDFHHYLHSIHNKEIRNSEMEDLKNRTENINKETNAVESWCVVWYLGAFGSLVCFFLIITCTELFSSNSPYRNNNLNGLIHSIVVNEKPTVPETPPPPYHLFAPPDYFASVQTNVANVANVDDKRKSRNIFVVPIHQHPFPRSGNSNNQSYDPPKYDEATCKMLERNILPIVISSK